MLPAILTELCSNLPPENVMCLLAVWAQEYTFYPALKHKQTSKSSVFNLNFSLLTLIYR